MCYFRPRVGHVVLTFRNRSFTFNSNKSPTGCNNFLVYYPDVCLQLNLVSGVFPPIIRRSITALAASGFTFVSWWQSCCVRGRAGRPKVKPEAATAIIDLLMMGGKTPETCWVVKKVRIINWKIVASGWWFIWIVRWCTDLQTLNSTFKC